MRRKRSAIVLGVVLALLFVGIAFKSVLERQNSESLRSTQIRSSDRPRPDEPTAASSNHVQTEDRKAPSRSPSSAPLATTNSETSGAVESAEGGCLALRVVAPVGDGSSVCNFDIDDNTAILVDGKPGTIAALSQGLKAKILWKRDAQGRVRVSRIEATTR